MQMPSANLIIRVLIQIFLMMVILFCVFGFGASFEYPSPNRYEVGYTLLFILFSLLFIRIANRGIHQAVSYIIVSFASLFWVMMLVFEVLHSF